MTLRELVLLAGGSVNDSHLPPCISLEQYERLSSWLSLLQHFADGHSKASKGPKIVLLFARSPSLVCRVRTLEDGSVAIILPLGLPARVRVLARLLLGYFEPELDIKIVASLVDDIPESDWEIAPSLVPLFGEFADESEHWQRLDILDSQLKLAPEIEPAVDDLLWVAVCYLTCHELAHAIQGHFPVVERARVDSRLTQQIGDASFRKALEVDADHAATTFMLLITHMKMESEGVEAEIGSAFFWIGYAITLIFGLYDSRRKALSLYSESFYPHPVIRHALFLDFATEMIAKQLPAQKKIWGEQSVRGWEKCVHAFRRLDVDVFTGKFGADTKNTEELVKFVPVTAMNYNIFDSSFVSEKKNEERALASRILQRVGLGSTSDDASG